MEVLVTGAGGFIGHHLTSYLVDRGYWVRGADIKYPDFERTRAHEFEILDLCRCDTCLQATRGIDEVYALAANMGGIGFIHSASDVSALRIDVTAEESPNAARGASRRDRDRRRP